MIAGKYLLIHLIKNNKQAPSNRMCEEQAKEKKIHFLFYFL